MSVGPRIVFVRFLSDESPKLTPWIAHVSRVMGPVPIPDVATAPTDNDDRLVWQLVSANNRQLARGVGVHTSFEAARTHAGSVVTSGQSLDVELVSEAGRGMYGWFALLDGVPVMTCARWYLTDRDRRHSIELAIRSVPVAVLHEGARLTDPALMAGQRGSAS